MECWTAGAPGKPRSVANASLPATRGKALMRLRPPHTRMATGTSRRAMPSWQENSQLRLDYSGGTVATFHDSYRGIIVTERMIPLRRHPTEL